MAARAYLHRTARRLARLHHPLLNRQSLHARAPFLQSRCNPKPQNFKLQTSNLKLQTSNPKPHTANRKPTPNPNTRWCPPPMRKATPSLTPTACPSSSPPPSPPPNARAPPRNSFPCWMLTGSRCSPPLCKNYKPHSTQQKPRATNRQPATAGVGRLWCTTHGPGEKEAPERRQRT